MFKTSQFRPTSAASLILAIMVMASLVTATAPATATPDQSSVKQDVATISLPSVGCGLLVTPLSQLICDAAKEGAGTAKDIAEGALVPFDLAEAGMGVAGSIAEKAADDIFGRIGKALMLSVSDMLNKLWQQVNSTTMPNFYKRWFIDLYGWAFALAIVIGFFASMLRSSRAAKDGDAVEFVKGPLGLALLIGAAGFIPATVGGLVFAFDGPATEQMVQLTSADMQEFFVFYSEYLTETHQYNMTLVAPAIIALFGVLGGILMYIEFQLREYALYILTAYEVIVCALLIAGKNIHKHVIKSTLMLVGMILFKFIATLFTFIAVKMMGDSRSDPSADPIVMGSVLLLLLPFLTWAAYKHIISYDPQPMPKLLILWRTIRK